MLWEDIFWILIMLLGYVVAGIIAFFGYFEAKEADNLRVQVKDMHERINSLSISVGEAYQVAKSYKKFIISKDQWKELLRYLSEEDQAADVAPWEGEEITLDPKIVAKIEEILAKRALAKFTPGIIEEAEVVLVTPAPASVPLIAAPVEAATEMPEPAKVPA